MPYTIKMHPDARDDLAALPRRVQRQIDKKLLSPAKNPRPTQAEPLKGKKNKNLWRVRSGDYRIIYEIRESVLVVLVVRIGNRKEIYRRL